MPSIVANPVSAVAPPWWAGRALYATGPSDPGARGRIAEAVECLRGDGALVYTPLLDAEAHGLGACLEADAAALLDADAVVLLDGWEKSSAAVAEVDVAVALGVPVMPLGEFLLDLQG